MQVISAVSSLPKSIRVDPVRTLFSLPDCNYPIFLSSLNVSSIPFLLITRGRLIYTYVPALNVMKPITDDICLICYGEAAIEEGIKDEIIPYLDPLCQHITKTNKLIEEIRNNANISRNNHSA